MKQKAAVTTTQSLNGKDLFTAGRIALDFIDTSWRIAVPVVLLAVGGIFADRSLESAPWMTLLGTVAGFAVAGLLIRQQIAAVRIRGGKL